MKVYEGVWMVGSAVSRPRRWTMISRTSEAHISINYEL